MTNSIESNIIILLEFVAVTVTSVAIIVQRVELFMLENEKETLSR